MKQGLMKRVYKRLLKGLVIGTGCSIIFTLAATWAYKEGYRFCDSPSIPIGIWKIERQFDLETDKGRIVIVHSPNTPVFQEAIKRGYIKKRMMSTAPIGKPVVGVPGDVIEFHEDYISINGVQQKNSKRLSHDAQGRPLPMASNLPSSTGKFIVPQGKIWIMSDYVPESFDSRYFGAINIECVHGVMVPIWIDV